MVSMSATSPVEERVREACARDDWAAAATAGLEGYGPELFGFLVNVLGDRNAAEEVFSDASRDLWQGISGFRLQASFRSWAYAIARNAASRYRARPRHQQPPLSQCPEAEAVAVRARTATAPFLRTSVKLAARQLRDELSAEDRALLVLKVDRQLSWEEVAQALADPMAPPALGKELQRAAAAARKRFQRVKDALRERAREQGLLPDPE
jgi:RNA polymerase sigma-70 factor (ECF subfamily)